MRYIDLEGNTHKPMDVGRYRHNYEGFYEKSTYQMFINRGENDDNARCPSKPLGNSLFYYLSLLVKSFEEEIQPSRDCVDTSRG